MPGFFDNLGNAINGVTSGGKFFPDASFKGDTFDANGNFTGYSSNGSSVSGSSSSGSSSGDGGAAGALIFVAIAMAVLLGTFWVIAWLLKNFYKGYRMLGAGDKKGVLYMTPLSLMAVGILLVLMAGRFQSAAQAQALADISEELAWANQHIDQAVSISRIGEGYDPKYKVNVGIYSISNNLKHNPIGVQTQPNPFSYSPCFPVTTSTVMAAGESIEVYCMEGENPWRNSPFRSFCLGMLDKLLCVNNPALNGGLVQTPYETPKVAAEDYRAEQLLAVEQLDQYILFTKVGESYVEGGSTLGNYILTNKLRYNEVVVSSKYCDVATLLYPEDQVTTTCTEVFPKHLTIAAKTVIPCVHVDTIGSQVVPGRNGQGVIHDWLFCSTGTVHTE